MKPTARRRRRALSGVGQPRPEVSVIIPVFEEEGVIGSLVSEVHQAVGGLGKNCEVLVVDDGSQDGTAMAATAAGATVVRHPYNMGNGAAIKTGIRNSQGRHLVFMDGDGQHSPEDIPKLLSALGDYDMVVAARNARTEAARHRRLANFAYNGLASYVCGLRIVDLTSGFRAVRGRVAREFVHLLPNTFSYPTTLTLAVVRSGYSIEFVPVKFYKRYGRSKIRLIRDGTRFLIIIFKVATLFSPIKVFLPISAGMFLVGFGYGLFKVLALSGRYGPTSAMLMTLAGVVFLIGLVSEQITQLRYERDTSL